MGDVGEDYREYKDIRKTKKQLNKEQSTAMLNDFGVEYASHNNGSHIVIKHGSKVVDFWPSTGLWIIRGVGGYARGINKLLIKLGVKK